jgi:hypothetical protein
MTHNQHGTKECETVKQLQYRLYHAKTEGEKKTLRDLIASHKISCPICNPK